MTHKIDAVIGEDTMATVEFEYWPPYPQTKTDPPCDAEVEIYSVMVGQGDFLDDLNETALDRIKIECFEHIRDTYGD